MKSKYFLGVILILIFTTAAYSQPRKQVQGVWRSYSRPNTITVIFSDTLIYFMTPTISILNQNVFSFFIYDLSSQLMIQIKTPDQKSEARFRLWIVDQKEIKLQAVDPDDFDNPKKHIPKETDANTFRLKKIGR